jgi:hypothetical protein
MAANRILYISYNPATLIRDEQALIRSGYEVDSVFGADGLMACGSVAEYASVLIDDACPLWRRKKVLSWLRSTYPKIDMLPTTGFASSQPDGDAGPMMNGIYLSEAMRTLANCGP